jgi:hypothetical protein
LFQSGERIQLENVKKSPILRILISAILFSLICGIFVGIISLKLGWKTSTQFSDGFFWAGAIMLSLGLLTVLGRVSQGTISETQYRQTGVHLDMAERSRQWAADISQGYNILTFLGTSGLMLCGLSGLVIPVWNLF